MRGKINIHRDLRLLVLCLLIILLITACSAGADIQTQSLESAKAAMAASNSISVEVPKQGEPPQKSTPNTAPELETNAMQSPQSVTLDSPASEPSTAAVLPNIESLQTENGVQPAAASSESSPPVALEAQNMVPPAVDLSLAVEPRVGFRAPDFSLQGLDGQTYRMGDLIGKNVVVNYWATWCIPCMQELPILQKLHQEYIQRGVVFISVNALDQDKLDKVQETVNQNQITFPVLLDQNRSFADAYQAIFFPTTFIIDASGVIHEVSLGDNTEAELRSSLEKLLVGSF